MGAVNRAWEYGQLDNGEAEQRWVSAISDLIALTENNVIQWKPVSPGLIPALGENLLTLGVYEAEYAGKRLLLQEVGRRLPTAGTPVQSGGPAGAGFPTGQVRSGGWTPNVVHEVARNTAQASLRIVDENNNPTFVFPQVNNLIELVAAVKYQLADVESFLSRLAGDAATLPK